MILPEIAGVLDAITAESNTACLEHAPIPVEGKNCPGSYVADYIIGNAGQQIAAIAGGRIVNLTRSQADPNLVELVVNGAFQLNNQGLREIGGEFDPPQITVPLLHLLCRCAGCGHVWSINPALTIIDIPFMPDYLPGNYE